MITHRRAGKTTACLMDMLDAASRIMPPAEPGRFAYIAPLRNQAKTVAWDMLKAFARPILKGDPNEAELRLDIHGGSRIQLFGADNPDALRGQAFNGVVLDEYGDMTPKLFGAVVRPALSDRRGYAVIVGTIKGRNHFGCSMSRRWPIHHVVHGLSASFPNGLDSRASELADAARR